MSVLVRDIAESLQLHSITVMKTLREMNICMFTVDHEHKKFKAISQYDMRRLSKHLNIKIKLDEPEPEPPKTKILLKDAKLSKEQIDRWFEHVGSNYEIILQENPGINRGDIGSSKDYYLDGEISTKIGKTIITLKV